MKHPHICYIVCALPQSHAFVPNPGDLVIAADGGYAHLHGIQADLVVGDFDSLGFIPAGESVVRHPAEKDDTDTMLAVKTGLERGETEFHIYGGMGGRRTDHTVANFQALLYLARRGARGWL